MFGDNFGNLGLGNDKPIRSWTDNWKQSWNNPFSKEKRKTSGDLAKTVVVGFFRALSYLTLIVPVAEGIAFWASHKVAVDERVSKLGQSHHGNSNGQSSASISTNTDSTNPVPASTDPQIDSLQ